MISQVDHISILTSADEQSWNSIFNDLPVSLRDINYSFDYNLLYEKNGDGEIRLFVFRKDGNIYFYPFLLRKIVVEGELTAYKDIETVYGYTGPISNTSDKIFIEEADQAFREFCTSEKIITEFIRFNPLLQNQRMVDGVAGLQIISLRDYVAVDLSHTADGIFAAYSAQNRNKIRKAEKVGAKIVIDHELKNFDSFVSIYLENMERLHATQMYFFSDEFFKGLKALTKKSGVLLHAMMDGQIVGSTIFFKSNQYSHYFLSSATEFGRKNAVSNLMLHEGLLWAKRNGATVMHLGGGVSAEEKDPLLVFKKNFSDKIVNFCIGKRVHNEKAYAEIAGKWDMQFPEHAMKYKSILQRYRLTKEDLI